MRTLNEEHLKELQDSENFFSRANNVLGSLLAEYEFKKADILSQISDASKKREDLKNRLAEVYGGNVTINIQTGEITEQDA